MPRTATPPPAALKSALREQLPVAESVCLRKTLDGWNIWQSASRVAAFVPLRDEPTFLDPWPVGKMLGFPRVEGEKLDFRWAFDPAGFDRGILGVAAPSDEAPRASGFDLVLVPGLAFDRKGRRLGRGKGFYDRFLRELSGIPIAGLCASARLIDEVPVERHDVPVHYIITEREIVEAAGRSGGD